MPFKFKQVDTVATTQRAKKCKAGVVTLSDKTTAFLKDDDGVVVVHLHIVGKDGTEAHIFNLRLDPKFKSGKDNFKFKAIEELRKASGWDASTTVSETKEKSKGVMIDSWKANVNFDGVDVALQDEWTVSQGKLRKDLRIVSAGRGGVSVDGSNMNEINFELVKPKSVLAFEANEARVAGNVTGEEPATPGDVAMPWGQAN